MLSHAETARRFRQVGSYYERYQDLGRPVASCAGAVVSLRYYRVDRDHIGDEMLVSVFAAILRCDASWFPALRRKRPP